MSARASSSPARWKPAPSSSSPTPPDTFGSRNYSAPWQRRRFSLWSRPEGDCQIDDVRRDSLLAADTRRVDLEARKARWRYIANRVVIYAILLVFTVIYGGPALIVFFNSFRNARDVNLHGLIALPQSFSFQSWARAWNSVCVSGRCAGISPNFFNSVRIAVPATIITTALGLINGYILSKWRFRGSEFIFFSMLVGVFMPSQITLLPWAYIIGKLGLANNVNGLLLIHSVQGISFATLFCRNYFVQLPDELIKAARIDGAGFWRIFYRVVLPLSPPILIVTVIWQFTSIWNEYLFGMVFTSGTEQPITTAILGAGVGSQSAAVIIAALPPLLIYIFCGKYFVRGLTQGALK